MRLVHFSAAESVRYTAVDKGYRVLFCQLSCGDGDLALQAPLTTAASSQRGGLFMLVQE